jgi:hypothetical protein
VFLAAITGALLRWLLLAVLALRRTRRLAPHPVLFAIVTFISGQVLSSWLDAGRRSKQLLDILPLPVDVVLDKEKDCQATPELCNL